MIWKILLSVIFFLTLAVFYFARIISKKVFKGSDTATIVLKIASGIAAVACAILAVYV